MNYSQHARPGYFATEPEKIPPGFTSSAAWNVIGASDADHGANSLDDDLRDDGHQDEGHGVGGSVADHRGLGIRLAGDGAQGRGGGHAAADAAQAFQNVHLEDFHADKVAGEHARAGDDDAHHKDGRAVGGHRVHQVRAALDARVCQEEDQAEVLKKQACGARDVPHNGPQAAEVAEEQGDDQRTAGNSQRNAHSVAQAEVDQPQNDAEGQAESQGKEVRLIHVLAAVSDFFPVFGEVFRRTDDGEHVVSFQRCVARGDKGEPQPGDAGDDDAVRAEGFQLAELASRIVLVGQDHLAAFLLGVHGIGVFTGFPQERDVVRHGIAVAYDEDFRPFSEGVFRRQGHQPAVAHHAGYHAVQAVQQLAVRNVLAEQVGLVDAHQAGNDAGFLLGVHGPGLLVQVKVQQARQELNEQNHAYDPERIGNAVADADAAAGSPGQAFRGGRKRRSAGAGPRKDAGGNTRRHIEPDAAQAGEQGGNAHNYGGHHGQFAALLGDGGKEAVACAQPHAVHEERQAKLPHSIGNGQPVVAGGKRHEEHAGKAEVEAVYFNAAKGDAEEDDSEKDQGVVVEQDVEHVGRYQFLPLPRSKLRNWTGREDESTLLRSNGRSGVGRELSVCVVW